MARTLLTIALASAIALLAGTAEAQNQQQPATEQCAVMRAMQWLANVSPPLDAAARQMLDERERVACAAGIEAAPQEYWPNGVTLRSGDAWYYPNGVTYTSGSAWYYPNGVTFASSNAWYYPNGVTMAANGTWYAPDGATSSETGLMTFALSRLRRERGDELLGLRGAPGCADFWRMVYLLTMVWEARG